MNEEILNEFSIYDTSVMLKRVPREHRNYPKKIYFLLTNTKTFVGNAILKVTQSEYNHISLVMDKYCRRVYGFGRNTDKNESGFIKEDLTSGIYKNNEVTYALYSMGVTSKEYNNIERALKQFEINKDKFKFDKLGLVLSALNIPLNQQSKYFCSGFVQKVLTMSGIKIFDKNYALVRPNDFTLHPDIKRIKEGSIKDLVKEYNITEGVNMVNDLFITEDENGIQLSEAASINKNKRKKIEETIYGVFNILDKSGANTKKYKEKFSKMNDAQFDTYMKKFLKDEKKNFYLEIVPFDNEPTLSDIEKAAKYLNIPLDEYVYLPFQNPDGEPIRTAQRVPVGLE